MDFQNPQVYSGISFSYIDCCLVDSHVPSDHQPRVHHVTPSSSELRKREVRAPRDVFTRSFPKTSTSWRIHLEEELRLSGAKLLPTYSPGNCHRGNQTRDLARTTIRVGLFLSPVALRNEKGRGGGRENCVMMLNVETSVKSVYVNENIACFTAKMVNTLVTFGLCI